MTPHLSAADDPPTAPTLRWPYALARLISASWLTLFVLIVAGPLILYFAEFFRSPIGPVVRSYSSPEEISRLAALLARTIFVAALAACFALAMACILFVALALRPPRRRAWFLFAVSLPFFIPGHFEAMAWIQTIGFAGWITTLFKKFSLDAAALTNLLYSPFGCAAVMAFHAYPVALSILWIGRRSAGREAIESAATLMPPGRLWSGFLFGWLRRWLAIAWLVIFILSLLDFSVPSLLRLHVFTVEIMSAFNVYYDPPRAMVLAMPLLAVSLFVALLLGRLLSRAPWPAFSAPAAALPALPSRQAIPIALGAILIVAGALFVPLGTFLRMAGGWESYRTVLVSARPQIWTSLIWSGVTAISVTGIAIGLSNPDRRILPAAMLILFAVPGSLIGMAHLQLWNRPWIANNIPFVYDAGLMLPLGLTAATLPVAYFLIRARRRETPASLLELESLTGANPLRRWPLLVAPRLARASLFAAILVFVLAMHDVHSAILLVAPGQETLSIRAFTLLHMAPDGLVAAICLVTLGVIALGVVVALALGHAASRILTRLAPHCALD